MVSWDTVGGIQALGCPQGPPQTRFGVAQDGPVEGFGDLAVFGGLGVKNHPPKKVLECVWGYCGRVLMVFPHDFDAFWAL